MSNAILIRDASPAELDEIDALVKAAYLEFRPLFPEKVWQAWMDNVSQTVRAAEGMLIVAVEREVIQGAIKFYPDASRSGMGQWPEGVAAIRILAVSPQARGRGYGTLLARECVRRAEAMQISTIFLFTGEFMYAARHIYEKLGFRRAPEFDRDPGPIAYHLDLRTMSSEQ
jgi:ribosomal protein S18 acetylase RimI-like enzyme